jgi:hypothetical protein
MPINLQQIVGSALDTAWEVASSIKDVGTFTKVTSGTYNPTTGATGQTTTATAVNALFGAYDQREIDGENVKHGDKKIFIRSSELAVAPERNDYYLDAQGLRWNVIAIKREPTAKLWIVQGRVGAP